MNIDIFFKMLEALYRTNGPFRYTLEDYKGVFRYFFDRYEQERGEKHPPISWYQTLQIMNDMPYIDRFSDMHRDFDDVEPDEYPAIIDKYFDTPFKRCDYRINHFFSGDVRLMRIYELQ